MANITHGMRGSADYPASQRPGHFGKGMKILGSRLSRGEMAKKLKQRKQKKKRSRG